jgi:hypothetical protein
MSFDVNAFVTHWVYDIRQTLERELDSLKDDLRSDDEHAQQQAARVASKILAWLLPAPEAISEEKRLLRFQEAMKIADPKQLKIAVLRAARTTGRRKGRPRDESSQHAIRALTLHIATEKSWREIALELRGCTDKRPNPSERACIPCGETIRKAAERLRSFLKAEDLYPQMPDRKTLMRMSPADLKCLWRSS